MSLTEEEHLAFAKQIAAAKRGEGEMPSIADRRRMIDSLRIRREIFIAQVAEKKKERTKERAATNKTNKKAVIENLDFGDLFS